MKFPAAYRVVVLCFAKWTKKQNRIAKKLLVRNTNEKSLRGIKLNVQRNTVKPYLTMTILFHFPLSEYTPYCFLLQTSILVGSDKCFRFLDLNNNNLPVALLYCSSDALFSRHKLQNKHKK